MIIATELYVRTDLSKDPSVDYVKKIVGGQSIGVVIGDSQVGHASHINGYRFFGNAGQQPEEFERISQFIKDDKMLRHVIIQAAPQVFGEYHKFRTMMIDEGSLPPRWFPMYLLSSRIRNRLGFKIWGGTFIEKGRQKRTQAGVLKREVLEPGRPSRSLVRKLGLEWADLVTEIRKEREFQWSEFPERKRIILTTSRVFEQRPREGFFNEQSEKSYRNSIELLLSKGIDVCLFRTPVTGEYELIAKEYANDRYEAFNKYIEKLVTQLNIPYVDYKSLPMEFDNAKFLNQDHLNHSAASKMWSLVRSACEQKHKVQSMPAQN